MFRSAALPLLRSASAALPRASLVTPAARLVARQQPAAAAFARTYSAAAGLDREVITSRILEVVKSFEKVDEGKLTPTATFTKDLGLDSLDAVEVVMAIEEEFAIEIPDEEADAISSVDQAIEYIAKTPEAH